MITSLQIVGTFLSHVGFQMLLDIYLRYGGRQVFYPRYRAKRIDVVMNPDSNSGSHLEYHTTVERADPACPSKSQLVKFVSRNVVLASGGKQKAPALISLKKLDINTKRQKIYVSDDMLKERGFRQLVTDIKSINSERRDPV